MVRKSQNKSSSNKFNRGRYDSFKAKQSETSSFFLSGDKSKPSLVSNKDIINNTFVVKPTPFPNVLDIDEFVPIENDANMKIDNTDCIVMTHPTLFAYTTTIDKSAKELLIFKIILDINNCFAKDNVFKEFNVR